MARHKIDYGIDLGTTNSAIARMENGEPIIKKTRQQNDTLPSCVYFAQDKRGQQSVRVGFKAKNSIASDYIEALKKGNQVETFGYLEFKREMGRDTIFHNSHMKKDGYTPVDLSSEVLKELKSVINDEDVKSIVVTVPAKFNVNQDTATKKAAELAGFKQCELLQEPIAACYAYGVSSSQKNGFWLVFDFGGGTFDAALVRVEDGIMSIVDTEGNNWLGGKNLDEAVINKILIPKLQESYTIDSIFSEEWKIKTLRVALKAVAEELRINLSFDETADFSAYDRDMDFGEDDNGETIEPDFSITRDELSNVIKPIYQEAVDICQNLLRRNNLSGDGLASLILVGGPTMSPIVRDMLRQQITEKVDTNVDPMTVVARGAALYASTIDIGEGGEGSLPPIDVIKLNVGYQPTTVEDSQWVSISLDQNTPIDNVQVEFERSDKAFMSERIEVNKQGNVLELHFQQGKPNAFTINCYGGQGKVECFPSEITIIQGAVVGNATLPYDIAIGVWSHEKERAVIMPIKGLERNKPLPATGVDNERHTLKDLRPGIAEDKLVIPIYQADEGGRGRSVSFYDQVCEVIITGDEVDQFIPANSDVHITLKADRSMMMSMEVYFPSIDFTVSKDVDTSKTVTYGKPEFMHDLRDARSQLASLENEGINVSQLKSELNKLEEESNSSDDWMKLRDRLRLLRRKIEETESMTEWERLEKDLRESYDHLEKTNNDLGNERSSALVNQFHTQVENVIQSKNVMMGREVLENMNELQFHLARVYYFIHWISDWNQRFNSIRWKNAAQARNLINQGMAIAANQPTAERLSPIIKALVDLLPPDEIDILGDAGVGLE
jgi:molecular chaperone DnaK